MPCNWQVLRPRDSPRAEETSAAMAMVHGDTATSHCGANCKERRGEWVRAWKTVRDCMQCRSPCVSVTLGPLGMWRRAWSLALWPLLLASILAGERACMGARCRSGSWCILFPALTTALAFLSCSALLCSGLPHLPPGFLFLLLLLRETGRVDSTSVVCCSRVQMCIRGCSYSYHGSGMALGIWDSFFLSIQLWFGR
jgi:hypothetical protein